jgi:hypothetical protein
MAYYTRPTNAVDPVATSLIDQRQYTDGVSGGIYMPYNFTQTPEFAAQFGDPNFYTQVNATDAFFDENKQASFANKLRDMGYRVMQSGDSVGNGGYSWVEDKDGNIVAEPQYVGYDDPAFQAAMYAAMGFAGGSAAGLANPGAGAGAVSGDIGGLSGMDLAADAALGSANNISTAGSLLGSSSAAIPGAGIGDLASGAGLTPELGYGFATDVGGGIGAEYGMLTGAAAENAAAGLVSPGAAGSAGALLTAPGAAVIPGALPSIPNTSTIPDAPAGPPAPGSGSSIPGGITDVLKGVDWMKLLPSLLAGYASYQDAKKPQLQGYSGSIAPRTATRTTTQGKYGPISQTTYGAAAGGMMPQQGIASQINPRYLATAHDGMADGIAAHIDGKQPAALSGGEFVIPADVVSHFGNGNSNAGAKQLYAMMERIRQARTGSPQQGKEIDPNKFMPI